METTTFYIYLEAHGTEILLRTGLITLPLIGVTPISPFRVIISRARSTFARSSPIKYVGWEGIELVTVSGLKGNCERPLAHHDMSYSLNP